MITLIKVTKQIENNPFGYKFEGTYLSEKELLIKGHSEVVDKIPEKILFFGNTVVIDANPIRNDLVIGKIYRVEALMNLYANNPVNDIVLTVTKIL